MQALIATAATRAEVDPVAVQVIAVGRSKRLDKLPAGIDTLRALCVAINRAAVDYCGAANSEATDTVIKQAADTARNTMPWASIPEITLAHQLAAAGRLGSIDMTAYGGRYSVELFGRVMRAYKAYREKVVEALEQEAAKADDARRESTNKAKAERWRKELIDGFVRGTHDWKTWAEVPLSAYEILLKLGHVKKDVDLWNKVKRDIIADLKAKANAGEPDDTLGSKYDVRNVAARHNRDPDIFPTELLDRAKTHYKKQAVFSQFKPV